MDLLVALAITTLSIKGRASATPSIAAAGPFVAVAWSASDSDGRTDIYAAISRDGGTSFTAPVRVNDIPADARVSGEQPPRVVLVPRPPHDPDLVVTWTAKADRTVIRTARSVDGGKTFTAAGLLERADASGARGWESLAVDPQGSVHAVWLDHRELAPPDPRAAQHSSPGGMHASMAHASMAERSAIYHTTLGGREEVITHGVCYCCKTALAAGMHGEIYTAWRQVYAGNVRDIAFSLSRDGGKTFADPVRVSRDGWVLDGCPDDGPAMAVDGAGVVYLVWPTLVETPEPHVEIFYASSRDGRTFTPRQRIETLGSPKPSHPQLALLDGGRLAVGWDEIVNGMRRGAVRILTPTSTGRLESGGLTTLDDTAPALYPAVARVRGGVLAAWTRGTGDEAAIGVRRIDVGSGRDVRSPVK